MKHLKEFENFDLGSSVKNTFNSIRGKIDPNFKMVQTIISKIKENGLILISTYDDYDDVNTISFKIPNYGRLLMGMWKSIADLNYFKQTSLEDFQCRFEIDSAMRNDGQGTIQEPITITKELANLIMAKITK